MSFAEINYFQIADIWVPLNRIRTILAHPCPQNPTTDALPEELVPLNVLDNFPNILARIKDKKSELGPQDLKVKALCGFCGRTPKSVRSELNRLPEILS